MELFILTSALDRSQAAVTSATDTAVLSAPNALPQLVIGTNEPLTVKHLTGASAFESWSGSASYTVVASLGAMSATGMEVYASTTLATVVADGKSGILPLTTAALAGAATARFSARPNLSQFILTLQITVTDPSGNKRVYAQIPVTVVGTVPTFTQT